MPSLSRPRIDFRHLSDWKETANPTSTSSPKSTRVSSSASTEEEQSRPANCQLGLIAFNTKLNPLDVPLREQLNYGLDPGVPLILCNLILRMVLSSLLSRYCNSRMDTMDLPLWYVSDLCIGPLGLTGTHFSLILLSPRLFGAFASRRLPLPTITAFP